MHPSVVPLCFPIRSKWSDPVRLPGRPEIDDGKVPVRPDIVSTAVAVVVPGGEVPDDVH